MADLLSRPAATALPECDQLCEQQQEDRRMYEVTDAGNTTMKVVVRVRPESEAELRSSCQCVVKVLDEHVLLFDPAASASGKEDGKKAFSAFTSPGVSRFFGGRKLRPLLSKKHKDLRFAFDRVFDETATQAEVFKHTAYSIIEGVLDGINCSIFAYGSTGAGKTHTMLGHPEDPGVIFLTMMELYRRIDSFKSTKTCQVSVSYCEVYNETIRDLLEPSGPLNLREDAQKGLVVSGLSCHAPQTAEEILDMLERGNNNRTQHPTEANATSSRSHAVFQVFVEQRPRTAGLSMEVTQGKMSLIDLAGSERATVTSNRGARLREGANINRSLLALGNCINALASSKDKENTGYVPYRDSKLTRLLKDSLGGNCRTVMVANISPSALSYEDTYNTLKYADRAKQIKTTLVRNVLQVDYHMTKYRAIIQELRKEITELKLQVEKSTPKQETFDPSEADRLCELLTDVYSERGRLRKHMADLDAKEREALLKVCRKERDLNRIDVLSGNDAKKGKVKVRLDALRHHLADIQRQKQTVNEYLYSNNESVGRVQGVVNTACRSETGGCGLQRFVEVVTEAKKLQVEGAHQWKQTKHLLKYIKNQEKEIVKTERILGLALSLVRSQQCLLKSADIASTGSIQDHMDSLTHLAHGDKGVAWADQTRISTNELQDVNVSGFSLTQQQLFDCFLEHSSPRVRGGFPRDSPQLYPSSLSILTSTHSRGEGILLESAPTTPTHSLHSSLQDLRVSSATPTSHLQDLRVSSATPTSHSGTLTVRASHTITSPHGNADAAPGGGSVTVTTDVCISSSELGDGGGGADDLSDVSSSGVGSCSSEQLPGNYDTLEKKFAGGVVLQAEAGQRQQAAEQPKAGATSGNGSKVCGGGGSNSGSVESLREEDSTSFEKVTSPTSPSSLQRQRPVGIPFFSRTLERPRASARATPCPTPPQPYSMFQPLHQSVRKTLSSTHMATPPTPHPPLSSQHSISTDSGIGHMTALPRKHGALVIPNRPLANGFMVRSTPSSAGYYSSSHYCASKPNAFEDNFVSPPQHQLPQQTQQQTPQHQQQALQCQQQTLQCQQQTLQHQQQTPQHQQHTLQHQQQALQHQQQALQHRQQALQHQQQMSQHRQQTPQQTPQYVLSKCPSEVKYGMKAPVGAMQLSSLTSPFLTATPNPYVKAPTHQPRPSHQPRLSHLPRPAHAYQSINIPTPTPTEQHEQPHPQPRPQSTRRIGVIEKPLSRPGSKSSQTGPEKSHDALNSTFTVEVGVASDSGSSVGESGKTRTAAGQRNGRGIFSRNRSPSKIPSYLKMTKSAESKKVGRLQNKENLGQPPTAPSGLMKKLNLNRSRERISADSSSAAPIGMSRFSSAPQLAWCH